MARPPEADLAPDPERLLESFLPPTLICSLTVGEPGAESSHCALNSSRRRSFHLSPKAERAREISATTALFDMPGAAMMTVGGDREMEALSRRDNMSMKPENQDLREETEAVEVPPLEEDERDLVCDVLLALEGLPNENLRRDLLL